VNVPYGGSVEVIMDFTNPVLIRGMSSFTAIFSITKTKDDGENSLRMNHLLHPAVTESKPAELRGLREIFLCRIFCERCSLQ